MKKKNRLIKDWLKEIKATKDCDLVSLYACAITIFLLLILMLFAIRAYLP